MDGDAGATNTLYYRAAGGTSWTTGSNRSGDGTIAQTGLDDNTTYDFIVVSSSGGYNSVPSACIQLHVTSGATKTLNILAVMDVDERQAELELLCGEAP